MILTVSIGGDAVVVTMDDEIRDQRPTPEVVEDYVARLRAQAHAEWLALPTPADAEPPT